MAATTPRRRKQDASEAASDGSKASPVAKEAPRKQPSKTQPWLMLVLLVAVAAAAFAYLQLGRAPGLVQEALQQQAAQPEQQPEAEAEPAAESTTAESTTPPNPPSHVEILKVFPHDNKAFTQGLFIANDGLDKYFIESTGLYEKSSLRKVDIDTGVVLAGYKLDDDLFAEGVTAGKDGEIVLLTWQNKKGLVLQLRQQGDFERFILKRQFEFTTSTGEGWGIDSDGTHLIVSDGSSKIAFWDPETMEKVREIEVMVDDHPIVYLNELEYANGYIYANVWYQSVIVKIDPETGAIVAVYDCGHLIQLEDKKDNEDAVLNGIAYDKDEDVFYLTGKLWDHVYKVRLHN